ncbi:hypothetical protein FRC12_003721 [Ceratobasidium sp. 428]|nr:hypothetical protein FRC12_003721 [Ceratobasidium sp. 428]
MTRTERAVHPRALAKDRSESRSGYDKSVKKGGSGGWGTLDDDIAVQQEDYDIHEREKEEARDEVNDSMTNSSGASDARKSPEMARRASITMTDEERQNARDFRASGYKGDIDLAAIARTSAAASTSPPQPVLPVLSNPNTLNTNP